MIAEASQRRKIDLIWLMFLAVVGSLLSLALATTVFDLTVSLSGVLCVGLAAIGRREGYLIGLYNSLSYSVLAYSNGLYGEVYLNLFFFVPTGVIGYIMWWRHTTRDRTVAMRQLTWPQRIVIAGVCVVCAVGLGVLLRLNQSQNTPFIDASTNVLSVVATFLMMWRYKEQWLLYIVLNVVSIVMWALRVAAGSESGDLMVLMWSLFLINAVFGYWRWHMGTKEASVNARHREGEVTCAAV
ncbi:MAG: nicotinamide riboside transporter PnuC [Patescibacteria group bacterium]|nr:nicotinamide riboside transporter PnuC [Patescibacteria group bacterium]